MLDATHTDDINYEDVEEVKLHLGMLGGWIYVKTIFERVTLNETELRYDGTPRNILEYAIIKRPGELVTLSDLKEAGIATSRDLRQITANAGIKHLARDLFMPVCSKSEIKIIREVTLESSLAESVMENLR